MNWDDLRVALAVHESGSYGAASARLGIDETTVARRLSRLQNDLGFAVFDAVDGARQPTPAGARVLGHAARIAQHAERIGEARDPEEGPVGHYRVAATDSVAVNVLAPNAAAFLAAHPGLKLEVLTSTENVNFSRWQADLAIRLRKPDKGDFIIAKLADMALYLFEPAEGAARDLVCAYPADLEHTPESQHLARAGLLPQARFISKNLVVIQSLLQSHRCCGVLPDYMCGDFLADGALRATRLEETREIWLLVQDHLKQDPGTRAVIDWLRGCFATVGRAAQTPIVHT